METLFELLIPLLFIAIILIVNILARVKEAQQGGRTGREGEDKPKATPWMRIAGQEQIRKFLEEAARGAAAKREERAPDGRDATRVAYGAPAGMPQGRVTPTARRTTAPAGKPPQTPRREARHMRTPPPAPKPQHVPVEKTQKSTRVRTRRSKTETRKFKGGLEQRMRTRKGAKPKAAGAPVKAGAIRKGEIGGAKPGRETGVSELLPEFSRGSLRRAIVMSEVLGTPVSLRPPRA